MTSSDKVSAAVAESASAGLYIRSALFSTGFFLTIPPYALLCVLTVVLPYRTRHTVMRGWIRLMLGWLALTCKLRHRADGLDNLPDTACIVMSNHQSTWETLALNVLLPPLTWVAKRELLWVPFFGWALAVLEPIALNRAAGHEAVEQFLAQGRERLAAGRWILVFPEGTRVPPGQLRRFRLGGAIVAAATGAPVIPVAHNAGRFWRRRGFVKLPGTIRISAGPAIETSGKTPEEVAREARDWIEKRIAEFDAEESAG